MRNSEKWIALIFGLCVFAYVLLRAIFVPTFHDEAATFFHYIVPGKFVPFNAHWDANNHFLNSALAYVGYRLFGADLIWIRLPNVLSFLIFIYYAFRISDSLKDRLLKWLLFVALLTAAFPLDFFSQARGYGMSLAFLLGAIHHGVQYFASRRVKHQLLLWCWMAAAVAANLALVNSCLIFLFVVVSTMVFKVDLRRWSNYLTLLLPGILVFSVVVYYGFELKEKGLLYTGSSDGFLLVTIRSLNLYQFGTEDRIAQGLIAILGGASGILVVLKLIASRFEWTVGRLAAVLLLLNVAGSILLNLIFGMNFPENRVGIYYIPLFLITFVFALDDLNLTVKHIRLAGLVLLFFPIQLLANINLNTTLLWDDWHVSKHLYNKAVEIQKTQENPLTINAFYLNELGWAFYNFQNAAYMQPVQRRPIPDTLADLIIARPEDFDMSSIPYDTVFHDAANGAYLLERSHPMNWVEAESVPLRLTEFNGTDEFYELLNDSINKLHAADGCFDLSASLKCENGMFDGHLIIASYNKDGEAETYEYVQLHWLRPEWNGEVLRLRRTYHFPKEAVTFKMYLWNMKQYQIGLKVEDFRWFVPG